MSASAYSSTGIKVIEKIMEINGSVVNEAKWQHVISMAAWRKYHLHNDKA